LAFCNPSIFGRLRLAGFLLPAALFVLSAGPAAAQQIEIIRDTEVERVMKGYEDPLLVAAGIDPSSVRMYLVSDPEINAAATQSPIADESEDIIVNTGTFLQLDTPNQMIGILAHETGHIAGGHLVRDTEAMQKASIPMLIGMAVGVIAMAAGGGEAGMGAIMLSQQMAESQFLAFSRAQESTADQMGQRFLIKTHQSGMGMLQVFQKFANDNARSAYYNIPFVSDHPADRERIDALEREVDQSPYKDTPDSPQVIHEFHMVQAKLSGFLSKPEAVLVRWPQSDQSEEAHYARAMAYFRKPDMKKAMEEITYLVKEEPKNPYFWELLGQIYVEQTHPDKGIGPYQTAVNLMPDAPLIRIDLARAQLAVRDDRSGAMSRAALQNLKIAVQQENDGTAWFEMAQAYSNLGNQPMADLSTAELKYSIGDLPSAARFASIAAHALPKGSPDWQRASDIMAIVGPRGRGRAQ
jgi:predicted Zn-dependent protease